MKARLSRQWCHQWSAAEVIACSPASNDESMLAWPGPMCSQPQVRAAAWHTKQTVQLSDLSKPLAIATFRFAERGFARLHVLGTSETGGFWVLCNPAQSVNVNVGLSCCPGRRSAVCTRSPMPMQRIVCSWQALGRCCQSSNDGAERIIPYHNPSVCTSGSTS